LAESLAIPAGSREAAVSFNLISERTIKRDSVGRKEGCEGPTRLMCGVEGLGKKCRERRKKLRKGYRKGRNGEINHDRTDK
jgi:hypothetical protein